MELKHRYRSCGLRRQSPFNRTSMELKRMIGDIPYNTTSAFNRTSMELKPNQTLIFLLFTLLTFNRTSMELKPIMMDSLRL